VTHVTAAMLFRRRSSPGATPRWVMVAMPNARGHLPTLRCPRGHRLRFRVKSWSEWGFTCDHPMGGQARCEKLLWLISLPRNCFVLLEVTETELREMERHRMGASEQLAYLFRDDVMLGPRVA
jgi:hypothetical protein